MKEIDWSLFESQEEEIQTINNELYDLRKLKYPQYRDSYYKFYNEFGLQGMVGDLYRKFDRLKNMSREFSEEDIVSREKEITDQLYDIISYCQLQLYWLRNEKWSKKTKVATNGTSMDNFDYPWSPGENETLTPSDNIHQGPCTWTVREEDRAPGVYWYKGFFFR